MKFKLPAALVLALGLASSAAFAESQIVFCEDFTDQMEPINAAETIQGTQVSWMTVLDEPVGKNRMVVSLYFNDTANNTQSLLGRETIEVNPKWNAYGTRYAQFPAYGTYELAFGLEDGTQIASGTVTLVEPTTPEAAPEPKAEEKVGVTLADLFNRYAPK